MRLVAAGAQQIPLSLAQRVETYSWRGLSVQRLVIIATPSCALGAGSYALEVEGLANAHGVLDQDRRSSTPDRFSAAYVVGGQGSPGCVSQPPPTRVGEPCTDPSTCRAGGEDLVCARASADNKGVCLPRERACAELGCAPDGQVCAVRENIASCVADCRKGQTVCPDNAQCNQQSGLCEPCSNSADCLLDKCKMACANVCNSKPSECQQCVDTCIKNNGTPP